MQKKKLIHKYIEEHQTTYQSNYKFHSCFQKTTDVLNFIIICVMLNFNKLIFSFEITLGKTLEVEFKLNLHEYERIALIVNALRKLEKYIDQNTILDTSSNSTIHKPKR